MQLVTLLLLIFVGDNDGPPGAFPHHDVRTHEGFHFRGAVGGGYLCSQEASQNDALGGGSAAVDVFVGGAVKPGLFLGVMFGETGAPDPDYMSEGASYSTAATSLSLTLSGLYLDGYIDPRGGLHILGNLALAKLSYANVNASGLAYGIGIGIGLGYDWWVGHSWSLGLLGRFNYAHSFSNGSSQDTLSSTVQFSFSYH